MKIQFYSSVDIGNLSALDEVLKRKLTVGSKCDFYFHDFYCEIWHDLSETEPPFLISILPPDEHAKPVYDHFSHLESAVSFIIKYLEKENANGKQIPENIA